MKFMLLALAAIACRSPDEVSIGVGHTFFDGGTASNETQTVALDQEDANAVWFEVTYFVRPRQVYVVQEERSVDWSAIEHQEPDTPTVIVNTGDDVETTTNNSSVIGDVKEAASWFDDLGLPAQIIGGVLLIFLLWICRKAISNRAGRMLRRGGGGTA